MFRCLGNFPFVGWKNESSDALKIEFAFDALRTFSSVAIYAHLPSSSAEFDFGFPEVIVLECSESRSQIRFNVEKAAEKIELVPKFCVGDRVGISLRHSSKWIAISEVEFASGK